MDFEIQPQLKLCPNAMLLLNHLSLQIVFLVLRVGMDRNKVWKSVGDAASKYREN